VYDVLNTLTSEKNGDAADPTGNDATAGTVNVSAARGAEKSNSSPKRDARRRNEGTGESSMFPLDDRRSSSVYGF
jgi:hypothetical protein